jgi:farnesyl-diphosphate farnesyltransferase
MAPSTTQSPLALLKDVSRSFYLTLRVLPGAVRSQIGLAYLLARTTDTIADTEILPVDMRLESLEKLRQRVLNENQTPLSFQNLAGAQGNPSERMLLERVEESLALLATCGTEDGRLIRRVLDIISGGQILDLQRFGDVPSGQVRALKEADELDDYTYRVAGCVGEFWTHICRAHLFPQAPLDEQDLLASGIRFGKGLQLVNILRDLPRDLRLGRCYLPAKELKRLGLEPADLLDPAQEDRFRPLYERYLELAEKHLEAGWRYTNNLPFGQVRVRLACAWPVLIGIKTLAKLKKNPILPPNLHVKVSRAEVRSIILASVWQYPWRKKWQQQFRKTGATTSDFGETGL